eukprot:694903-Rhodomonas_salina.1
MVPSSYGRPEAMRGTEVAYGATSFWPSVWMRPSARLVAICLRTPYVMSGTHIGTSGPMHSTEHG